MNNKGIVRYTKKNTRERARDEKQNKKKCLSTNKKKTKMTKLLFIIYMHRDKVHARMYVSY
jgi:hypothetical protein